MVKQLCACGCGQEARPGSIYALDHHRQRAYRNKVKRTAQQEHVPAYATLSNLTTGTGERNGDVPAPARQPRKRNPDLRISYRKAVDAVDLLLQQEKHVLGSTLCRARAEGALRPLLSAKQLASLDDGTQTRGAIAHV